MAVRQNIRRIAWQVVPVWSKMIVDDVEEHRDAASMRRLDKSLEMLRAAVAGVGCIRQHAVVAPSPSAGKVADRHDLNCGHSETREMVELLDGGDEGAFRCESPDMQFVEHRVVPRASAPILSPVIACMVDRLARPVDIPRLELRRRIGHKHSIRQLKPIERTVGGAIDERLEKAVLAPLHCDCRALFEHEGDALFSGRPEPEPDSASFEGRPMRPLGNVAHPWRFLLAGTPPDCKPAAAASVP